MAAKTKTEHYYSAHNVATRVNFGSTRQQSLRCGHNLRKPFLRATLAMTVGLCAHAEQFFPYQECNVILRGTIFPLPGV